MAEIAFTSLTPYLTYPDGDAAAEWLQRVLGFGPVKCMRDGSGVWQEGEVAVGDSRIDITGGREPGGGNGGGGLLIIGVDDVDAMSRRIRASGVEIDEPRDEEYGPRTCHVTDPWGYRWYFWQGDAVY
jgi:uncharacterized glyoxalase superfamily protein PhnB